MKIGIYGKYVNEKYKESIYKIFEVFVEFQISLWIHRSYAKVLKESFPNIFERLIINNSELMPVDLDFMISIGGDGTFLEAFASLKMKNIPLLGINTGRLGFLADISHDEVEKTMERLLNKDYLIEKRSVIKTELSKDQGISFPYAINDVTVHKRDSSSMITIHAYLNNEYLTTYWADGLVISTPSGSTAYSMSAGGPIVTPDSQSLIITPIANHNLTVRPLVLPDTNNILLKIEGRQSKFLLSLDSRSYVIEESLEIEIYKTIEPMNLVKFKDMSYYNTLRNKLMWGVDKRN
ncbi:MAG: NAD kinase [Salinivirgaceae bacterium]|nr:NAD kinase [Salinivirgaceae bacterium]